MYGRCVWTSCQHHCNRCRALAVHNSSCPLMVAIRTKSFPSWTPISRNNASGKRRVTCRAIVIPTRNNPTRSWTARQLPDVKTNSCRYNSQQSGRSHAGHCGKEEEAAAGGGGICVILQSNHRAFRFVSFRFVRQSRVVFYQCVIRDVRFSFLWLTTSL